MSYGAVRQLIPLLLSQPYLKRVSISKFNYPLEKFSPKIHGIDYCFDQFRNVARHLVGNSLSPIDPSITKYSIDQKPVHLSQMFASALGTQVEINASWLELEPSPRTQNAVVVSLTDNWRTYPQGYWNQILKGLNNIVFVGTKNEFQKANIANARFEQATNHLELAQLIKGSTLFLGTVSFPYSIAEALKVNRMVEICHHNLNAFPVGSKGQLLPPNIIGARERIKNQLTVEAAEIYSRQDKRALHSPLMPLRHCDLWRRTSGRLYYLNAKRSIRMLVSKLFGWIKTRETKVEA